MVRDARSGGSMIDVDKLISTLRRLYPSGGYVVDCSTDPASLRWQGGNGPTIEWLLCDECQSTLPKPAKTWTPAEFLAEFTLAEQLKIVDSKDSTVCLTRLKLSTAEIIRSDSPDVLGAMAALVGKKLLTSDRRDEILGTT